MFIIPLTGKISVRNPPIVTIAIVLINCLVWFGLQADDMDKQYEISEFYFTSGMANIEISYYIAYREGRLQEPVEVREHPRRIREEQRSRQMAWPFLGGQAQRHVLLEPLEAVAEGYVTATESAVVVVAQTDSGDHDFILTAGGGD